MIVTEIFNINHIRRYSDKGVKILSSKDGHVYEVAEDWVDDWFVSRGLIPPTYTETDIPVDNHEEAHE